MQARSGRHPLILSLSALAVLGSLPAAAATPTAAAGPAMIGGAEIVSAVESSVRAQLEAGALAEGATRVEVRVGAIDSRLSFNKCSHPIDIETDMTRPSSRVNSRVSCSSPVPWSIYIPVDIVVYRPVVVARRAFERGETVGPNDVELAERAVTGGAGMPIGRLEDAIGQVARRSIGINATVTGSALDRPLWAHRGDRVSITARAGGIAVQTVGEALSDGRAGDRIRVRNVRSKQVLDVVLTAPGTGEAY